MSESLFYNRDRNIDTGVLGFSTAGELADLSLYPVIGSTVSFESKNFSYTTDDNYYNISPASINNLTAVFKLRYDSNELTAQKLVDFFESRGGINPIEFNPDSSLYQTTSGFCDNYAVNHINKSHYEFAATLVVDQASSILNWSGMSFVSSPSNDWQNATSYNKFDVVYSSVNSNKLNNFFYCSGDHASAADNSPTGVNSMWTQDFFFKPDVDVQNEVAFDVSKLDFRSSFPLRSKTKDNTAIVPISYKFSNISARQTKAMLHFLENKLGYRKFAHRIPSVFNKDKIFYCPQWEHSWVYSNVHNLEVTFVEDPLGVIQLDT